MSDSIQSRQTIAAAIATILALQGGAAVKSGRARKWAGLTSRGFRDEEEQAIRGDIFHLSSIDQHRIARMLAKLEQENNATVSNDTLAVFNNYARSLWVGRPVQVKANSAGIIVKEFDPVLLKLGIREPCLRSRLERVADNILSGTREFARTQTERRSNLLACLPDALQELTGLEFNALPTAERKKAIHAFEILFNRILRQTVAGKRRQSRWYYTEVSSDIDSEEGEVSNSVSKADSNKIYGRKTFLRKGVIMRASTRLVSVTDDSKAIRPHIAETRSFDGLPERQKTKGQKRPHADDEGSTGDAHADDQAAESALVLVRSNRAEPVRKKVCENHQRLMIVKNDKVDKGKSVGGGTVADAGRGGHPAPKVTQGSNSRLLNRNTVPVTPVGKPVRMATGFKLEVAEILKDVDLIEKYRVEKRALEALRKSRADLETDRFFLKYKVEQNERKIEETQRRMELLAAEQYRRGYVKERRKNTRVRMN